MIPTGDPWFWFALWLRGYLDCMTWPIMMERLWREKVKRGDIGSKE